MVEGGIEADDLGQFRVQLRDSGDGRQIVGLMQRHQRNETAQLVDDGRIDTDRAGKKRSTMYHPMSGSDRGMVWELALDPAQERGDCVLMGGALCHIPIGQRLFRVFLGDEMHAMADAIEVAVAEKPFGTRSCMCLKWREFDVGRAGVQDQDGAAYDVARVISQRPVRRTVSSPYGHFQRWISGMSSPWLRT
jgi:hypothetical protein